MRRLPSESRNPGRRRSGKILVLTAALMPALIGGVALSVDTGVIGVGRAQVQTAADAAALAGARELAAPGRLKATPDMTALIANARLSAVARGGSNAVLGLPPLIGSEDVAVGYFDPFARSIDPGYGQFLTDSSMRPRFNSVQVKVARSEVPVYFGRMFGAKPGKVTATSRATIEKLPVGGFETSEGNPNLLPIVLDKVTYTEMVNGRTTDEYGFDPSLGVTSDSDGITESRLYPVRSGNPGNWGTVKIGVNNNSTAILGDQIRHGITPAQMNDEFPSGSLLDSVDTSTNPATPFHHFRGNPGISAGIKDDLVSIIGKPVTIPIYDQSGGNGNNAWYRVIEFAGVRILDVSFKGKNKYVIVQPADINKNNDPTARPETDPSKFPEGWADRSWTSGGIVRLHLSQ